MLASRRVLSSNRHHRLAAVVWLVPDQLGSLASTRVIIGQSLLSLRFYWSMDQSKGGRLTL